MLSANKKVVLPTCGQGRQAWPRRVAPLSLWNLFPTDPDTYFWCFPLQGCFTPFAKAPFMFLSSYSWKLSYSLYKVKIETFSLILWVFQSEDCVMSSLPCSVASEAELLCAQGSWASGRPLMALPLPICSPGCSRGQAKVIHSQTEALSSPINLVFVSLFVTGDTDLHVDP